jgi:hypothetical protein
MTMMLTLSTIVVGLVRVDPGYEVVVERDGELKGSAEGWKARSIMLLAHQSINKIQIHQWPAEGIIYTYISFITPVRLCNSAPVSRLFCNSPCNRLRMIEHQTALPRLPDAPINDASHTPKAPHLYRRSPSNIVTTVLRERQGSIAIRLGGTSGIGGGDRGWGRRLVLGALLVLFGALGD